jgi:hypothetical protein
MSADRYICCSEQRRAVLKTKPALSGIDFLEVRAGATTNDPTVIDIFLVNRLPLATATLTVANFMITGGVRFPAPVNFTLTPLVDPVAKYQLVIPGGQPSDFSTYTLSIITSASNQTSPAFLDDRLSSVDFSFKVECPSNFDCAPDCDDGEMATPVEPQLDYRARDYQGFRRLMLDRMATLVPGFREDDPVDFTTTLVEALAYRSDQQSYRLDWTGTEAFLSTARSRTSIARHARLVDYTVGEGANARLFAQFSCDDTSSDGLILAAATPLLVRDQGLTSVVAAADYARQLRAIPTVFETVSPLQIWLWRNAIEFYTWSDDDCKLAKGSTATTLKDGSGGVGALAPGDFLLLTETKSPETGEAADARADHRHVVRLTKVTSVVDKLDATLKLVLVEWSEADALPFNLVIQARKPDALSTSTPEICAVAAGNIMLTDHGASWPPSSHLQLTPAETKALRPVLQPSEPPDAGRWRPVLDRTRIARVAPVNLSTSDAKASAKELMQFATSNCRAVLELEDDFAVWSAKPDLLESGQFGRDFVLETGIDGKLQCRFGDNVNGLQPSAGTNLVVKGRFGSGLDGNIGNNALAHAVVPLPQVGKRFTVTNPLPGRGGAEPESIGSVRIAAPKAFRKQERAVTAADYAAVACRHPDVANAVAIPRWTGAWQTMLIYIDRRGGLSVDKPFTRILSRHMEYYRLMGFDVALRGAIAAPLDLEFFVCAKPDELRSTVAARVRDVVRPFGSGNGDRGFFHPDNFTFGSPLYLSQLIAALMAVEGVQSVNPRKFERLGRVPQNETKAGVIRPGNFEVLQLDDDPSFPERGRFNIVMGGGR